MKTKNLRKILFTLTCLVTLLIPAVTTAVEASSGPTAGELRIEKAVINNTNTLSSKVNSNTTTLKEAIEQNANDINLYSKALQDVKVQGDTELMLQKAPTEDTVSLNFPAILNSGLYGKLLGKINENNHFDFSFSGIERPGSTDRNFYNTMYSIGKGGKQVKAHQIVHYDNIDNLLGFCSPRAASSGAIKGCKAGTLGDLNEIESPYAMYKFSTISSNDGFLAESLRSSLFQSVIQNITGPYPLAGLGDLRSASENYENEKNVKNISIRLNDEVALSVARESFHAMYADRVKEDGKKSAKEAITEEVNSRLKEEWVSKMAQASEAALLREVNYQLSLVVKLLQRQDERLERLEALGATALSYSIRAPAPLEGFKLPNSPAIRPSFGN